MGVVFLVWVCVYVVPHLRVGVNGGMEWLAALADCVCFLFLFYVFYVFLHHVRSMVKRLIGVLHSKL